MSIKSDQGIFFPHLKSVDNFLFKLNDYLEGFRSEVFVLFHVVLDPALHFIFPDEVKFPVSVAPWRTIWHFSI